MVDLSQMSADELHFYTPPEVYPVPSLQKSEDHVVIALYPYAITFYHLRNKIEISVNSSFLSELNDPTVQDEMLDAFEQMADRHDNSEFNNALYTKWFHALSKMHTELMSKNPKYCVLSQSHKSKGDKPNAV